jgi:hypothetical protein
MPQLDSLTYCAQFVYLLVSFIGVYILTLHSIIPAVAATEKLRQKLNTVAVLVDKCDNALISLTQNAGVDEVVNTYELLVAGNLTHYAIPQKSWLTAVRMTQLCHTLLQKKSLCVRTIYMANLPVTNLLLE